MMTPRSFVLVAQALHRASLCDVGRTATDNALAELAQDLANIFAREQKFDRRKFLEACALREHDL
jgi:hypothetical protein